ncbi:hypothetical protein [Mucilaginibacter sp. CSA2-8R]|uniref:hypothetical protein n=1 Tax=Mucilaginibacter sp. CSA2-8R TaxID=3141542 RepID=UPI00315D75E2
MDKMGLWARLKSDTPRFFKKVQWLGASLVTLSAALVAVPGLPAVIVPVLGYVATVGGVMAAVSQFAVTSYNPEQP